MSYVVIGIGVEGGDVESASVGITALRRLLYTEIRACRRFW